MSVSLAVAGSATVPRAATAWLRDTALPAVSRAIDDVTTARARALHGFVGASGSAYSAHAEALLSHLEALRERLLCAERLFASYAERLRAHEAALAEVRARALAAGLQVRGDDLLPPRGLVSSLTWSELATHVLHEHRDLATWVGAELDAAVASFSDPGLVRWVSDFLDTHRVALASAGLEAIAVRGGGELAHRGLLQQADHLDRLARASGPAATVVNTVVALESDEPAEGLALVAGGAGLAALAPVLVGGAPVVLAGAVTVGLGILGARAAQGVWDRLPEDVQDSADAAVDEAWQSAKDAVAETWDATTDSVDDLGDSLVTWTVR